MRPPPGPWAVLPSVAVADGIRLRAVWLDRLMLTSATLRPGAEVTAHRHDADQIGTVLEGSLTLRIDGMDHQLEAGAVYLAPGGVVHGGRAGAEGCVLLEAFSPVREDFADRFDGRAGCVS